MKGVLDEILQRLRKGETAVLVTVIRSEGSTPRGAGAQMAVFSDGSGTGTVGGGSVEHEAQKLARKYLSEKKSAVGDFSLHANEAADLGMICGGELTLFFQFLAASEGLVHFLEQVVQLSESRKEMWLITEINQSSDWSMAIADDEGRLLTCCGDFPVSQPDPGLLGSFCRMERLDKHTLFVRPLRGSGQVYVFGGGHISQMLVPLLHTVFFPCTVVDDNGDYANRERFPQARQVIVTAFDHAFEKIQVEPRDYIVIVTRGHEWDYSVLTQSLKTEAQYIGMIGSRQKNDALFQKLIRNDGFTITDLRRIKAPIGLDIGGDTPQEIALSIAAQLVQVRAHGRQSGRKVL